MASQRAIRLSLVQCVHINGIDKISRMHGHIAHVEDTLNKGRPCQPCRPITNAQMKVCGKSENTGHIFFLASDFLYQYTDKKWPLLLDWSFLSMGIGRTDNRKANGHDWFRIPHMPRAGSLKVLHAPARRGGIRRASQPKIYNLETDEFISNPSFSKI